MKSSKDSIVIGRLPESGYVRQSQLVPIIVPFSSATLWRMVKCNEFPRPVKLSARVSAWRVEDIRAWMQTRESECAQQGTPAAEDKGTQ